MSESGIDPFTIAAIMGHKDIKTTAGYTGHFAGEVASFGGTGKRNL